MGLELLGRARVFGDDINTDYIITSRRKRESLDPQILKNFLFEEVSPEFAAGVQPGDLIVAGKHFGCGSAMEVAVTAVLGAGIRAVIAKSFSRTYFRNAINNGLLPIICDTASIREGDLLSLTAAESGRSEGIVVYNKTSGATINGTPLPTIMLDILAAGGLVPYFRRCGDFKV